MRDAKDGGAWMRFNEAPAIPPGKTSAAADVGSRVDAELQ